MKKMSRVVLTPQHF